MEIKKHWWAIPLIVVVGIGLALLFSGAWNADERELCMTLQDLHPGYTIRWSQKGIAMGNCVVLVNGRWHRAQLVFQEFYD